MPFYMENTYGTTLLHSLHGPEYVLLLLRAVGLETTSAETFFLLFSPSGPKVRPASCVPRPALTFHISRMAEPLLTKFGVKHPWVEGLGHQGVPT